MKKSMTMMLLLLVAMFCSAQMQDPVKFTAQLKTGNTAEGEIVFSGKIQKGWHVYSTNLGSDGPIEASFHVDKKDGVELVGKLTPRGKEISEMDPMFGMKLRYFEHSVQFVQKVKFTKPTYSIKCYLEFGACNEEMCMPPTQVELHKQGKSPAVDGEAAKEEEAKEEAVAITDTAAVAATDSAAAAAPAALDTAEVKKLWTPVIDELNDYDQPVSNSLFYIFLAGIVGGLVALFTPCVWPIIPMTVSFFLKRNKSRKKAIREAIIYGVSIVVIYVALGLVVSMLFGASALNALSTNAVFNIAFCLMLVVFAASFFGAFEITLPSSWSNKMDQKSEETSGLLSIFLMAFTLSLVSFSCTGPIIGFLLVAVASEGSIVAPTIGMLGFAIALAVPFALFAMFPTLLKSAPKSGGWMNVLKVTLGFVELAFALKFLSVADLAYGWHLLDREAFLALWIIIFALLGIYLLGFLKFPHDDPDERNTSVPRFFMALVSLAFAVYMVPGLWGAPVKAVSAFAPPISTQDFNLDPVKIEAKFRDYEAGMAYARQTGKPVVVDFTGHGCVNCRKMELAVWHDAKVRDLLMKDYVLISLYVDEKTPLPEPIEVQENGSTTTLRTVGDKWSYLQRSKFGANAQPFYVLVDQNGKPLNSSYSFDEDVDKFVNFLQTGLDNFRK